MFGQEGAREGKSMGLGRKNIKRNATCIEIKSQNKKKKKKKKTLVPHKCKEI